MLHLLLPVAAAVEGRILVEAPPPAQLALARLGRRPLL